MNQKTNTYPLEKAIWTDADFELMNWHDCPVHALSFGKNDTLLMDIDYIFSWVMMKNKRNYRFWIAPCTLVFENVYNIEFDTAHTAVIIDNLTREAPRRPKNAEFINREFEYEWIIDTTVGGFSFRSVGYKQYVRQRPVLITEQQIELEARGGISFSQDSI